VIRVFVVDDSAFIRRALTRVLSTEPRVQLVGEAASGPEAMAKIPGAEPDLVTLDLALPGADGLEVLRDLLRWKPTLRVLMLSAYTREGADATLEALAAGAVDFIDKTAFNLMDLERLRGELLSRILAHDPALVPRSPAPASRAVPRERGAEHPSGRLDLCVIGASTGGPAAVQHILERLPARFPLPIVVVQHMPPGFTGAFAQRLNGLCSLEVAEAVEGDRLQRGRVLVAPAGRHLRITRSLGVLLADEPQGARHVPSVDVVMQTAALARPGRVLAVLLTGMGDDGAEGMAAVRERGGVTLAESEATCVVYGMPRAAHQRGAVTHLLPLPEIAGWLAELH
jgi:two-component system, chemotaxis family, protein-glutamate methylesterase/glutaminase